MPQHDRHDGFANVHASVHAARSRFARWALIALCVSPALGACNASLGADASTDEDDAALRRRRHADAGVIATTPSPAPAPPPAAPPPPATTPGTGGLIQATDITYLGAFALPSQPLGTSRFGWGGHALTPYNDGTRHTLFMQGHAQNDGQVAQVEVPATFVKSLNPQDLPVARVLQNFADVTDGKLATAGDTYNGLPVFGLLPYHGNLIVTAAQSYGSSQVASHGVSGLDLSQPSDFRGFFGFGPSTVAPPRALGGPMTLIPAAWQGAFGGPALTGNCCLSIIGATSAGPSITVFDPDDVGAKTPIPGTTVLFYPLEHQLAEGASQNDAFNLTTRVEGVAFPPGSRSVLFFGTHGTGPYCYDTAANCNDPFLADVKGPHAPPYRDQVWAYDANDLVAVKQGQKQPWEVKPYAIWQFGTEMYTGPNSPFLQGAGYDPDTGRLFVAQDYGENPRIDVFQIATR